MTTETALPPGPPAEASAPTETQVVAAELTESAEGQPEPEKEPAAKPEKTADQREIDRLRRRIDNKTRQLYEARAAIPAAPQESNDDEPVTLTRAELNQRITEQAQRLAPTMREEQSELERRSKLYSELEKEWGSQEFAEKTNELADTFGQLIDRSGKPAPVVEAIFSTEQPKAIIDYLLDPDNADHAERIARMSAVQAGREISRLEDKLTAAKTKAKPQVSKAAAPLEAVKGGGVPNGMPDPANTKAYIAWANARERAAR